MNFDYDIVVVGAGIVGCATAQRLTRSFPHASIGVLERAVAPGLETSSKSSGVIHSGLHVKPTSLKAQLARQGRQLTIAACTTYDIPMLHCGMHVVVSPRDVFHLAGEIGDFFGLLARAAAQGITCSVVPPWSVRKREPAVRCLFGIHIPDVTVIDVVELVHAFAKDAQRHGVEFHYRTGVLGVMREPGHTVFETTNGLVRARAVVNAAGLGAVGIATAAGFPDYRVALCRGEYYEVIDPELRDAVSGLVYPVYRPGSPGLGIHLTKTVDGRLLVGPNAVLIDDPSAVNDHRTPPEAFLAAVQPFLPGLRSHSLRYSHAGIRTQYKNGSIEADFSITLDARYPPFVNCIGIESPGVTAAPAIAERVVELLTSVIAS